MKVKRIQIQGKWSAIRQYVESLIRDGWTEMIRTGEPDFRYTTVELIREV